MQKLREKRKKLDDEVSVLLSKAGDISRRIDGFYGQAEAAKKDYYRFIGEGERKLAEEKLDCVKPLRGKAAVLIKELRGLKNSFPELRDGSKKLWEEAAAFAVAEEEVFKKADAHIEKVRTFRIIMSECTHFVDRREKELSKIIARFD